MPSPGFGTQPQSRAARITVIGHASTRWRGARNRVEAARLNEGLSKMRAESVRARVEQILKQQVANLEVTSATSSLPGQGSDGVEVGSFGVGSREPVLRPPRISGYDPKENEVVNRSVQVFIEVTTTQYRQAGRSLQPLRISAVSTDWYGQVLDLSGVALGASALGFLLRLRNPHSDKTATYFGFLGGGGLSSKVSKPKGAKDYDVQPTIDSNRRNPLTPIGDEFSFYTDEPMRFEDFNGELVRVERLAAKVGIGAKVTYLNFLGLGGGAKNILFDKGVGVGNPFKPSLEGFVVSGAISMNSPNPGDWYEVEGGSDSVPYTQTSDQGDGLIISFPTGKSNVNDLSAGERKRLETFVIQWAARI